MKQVNRSQRIIGSCLSYKLLAISRERWGRGERKKKGGREGQREAGSVAFFFIFIFEKRKKLQNKRRKYLEGKVSIGKKYFIFLRTNSV